MPLADRVEPLRPRCRDHDRQPALVGDVPDAGRRVAAEGAEPERGGEDRQPDVEPEWRGSGQREPRRTLATGDVEEVRGREPWPVPQRSPCAPERGQHGAARRTEECWPRGPGTIRRAGATTGRSTRPPRWPPRAARSCRRPKPAPRGSALRAVGHPDGRGVAGAGGEVADAKAVAEAPALMGGVDETGDLRSVPEQRPVAPGSSRAIRIAAATMTTASATSHRAAERSAAQRRTRRCVGERRLHVGRQLVRGCLDGHPEWIGQVRCALERPDLDSNQGPTP